MTKKYQTLESVIRQMNKPVKVEEEVHENCGTDECCGECDSEQIDELSRNTLSNYMRKSSSDVAKPGQTAKKQDKRISGQSMADKKLRKADGYSSDAKVGASEEIVHPYEDEEQIDEVAALVAPVVGRAAAGAVARQGGGKIAQKAASMAAQSAVKKATEEKKSKKGEEEVIINPKVVDEARYKKGLGGNLPAYMRATKQELMKLIGHTKNLDQAVVLMKKKYKVDDKTARKMFDMAFREETNHDETEVQEGAMKAIDTARQERERLDPERAKKKLQQMKPSTVSFHHHKTGEKVSGSYKGIKNMGGRPYAAVEVDKNKHPQHAGRHLVPTHQIHQVHESLEIGTDELSNKYKQDTPGQTSGHQLAIDYVAKPKVAPTAKQVAETDEEPETTYQKSLKNVMSRLREIK